MIKHTPNANKHSSYVCGSKNVRLTSNYQPAASPAFLHPTKRALIEAFVRLSKDRDFSCVRVEELLAEAGASKGSLYHHFADLEELSGEAKAYAFSREIKHIVDSVTAVMVHSKNAEEFRSFIRLLLAETLKPKGISKRLLRARIIGASMKFPKLHKHIQAEQRWLTDEITQAIADAQRRGFVRPDAVPHITAVFVQTYMFGKLVDDISDTPLDAADWVNWMMSILDHKIFA